MYCIANENSIDEIKEYILFIFRYLYPHMTLGFCVIAQPKKPISKFIKIITFLSPKVMVGIIGICLLTYIFFVKSVGYIKAGLELIRLMVCWGFLYSPKINSVRIFICMVLILFLNINALFQSQLSSLLTVPVYYRDIDIIQSLKVMEKSHFLFFLLRFISQFSLN